MLVFRNLYWYKGLRRRKWRLVDRYGNVIGKPSREIIQGKIMCPLLIEDVNARKFFQDRK